MKTKKQTIILQNLSIGYMSKKSKKLVASDLSCSVWSGELTCLLGSNGVGKSTLLRTLCAFQPKLAGHILINGKDISSYREKELAKLISVVLTERFSIRNMTAKELISMGRSPYTGFWGMLDDKDNEIVDEAIRLVKIEKLANRLIDTLSDGERQKCLIAKALVQDTPIILLDEPTAFLDFPSKVELMQLLHRLSRETNKTIFLSTHDLELALQIADKIWLMDEKTGVQMGTPEDLALNNLKSFFAQKDIIFDPTSGLFRVENDYQREIRLEGHGVIYAMIRKALLRHKILASRQTDSEICIRAEQGDFRVYRDETLLDRATTIEELIDIINKLWS